MIEVTIDSVRVSLMSQHRVVVLKEVDGERYLPIWIGPFEADAITIQLQGVEVARPMTHDLLMRIITTLEAQVLRVVINDLQSETFYAAIVVDAAGELVDIDARPSDAIALAVRARVPIFIAETVMDRAAILAETDVQTPQAEDAGYAKGKGEKEEEGGLDIFREFVEGLDIDGFGD
ncbi:bifunctional nuclease family protein [Candidatus Amarolinea aalborgensis]|jgi:bifunctional DNase/RNase|uniref:bifunctional nuclease family protein n=1 Tax=Candidatus Amarolinea aalborgensis TaxID=2249329 RepID=UPI003BF99F86